MTLDEMIAQTQEGLPSGSEKKRRDNPETREQIELFKWLRANAGKHPVLLKPYAIPNGEKRDRVTASILKAAGVQAGVWDIFLPTESSVKWSAYIEMKAPSRASQDEKALSQEQKDFRKRNPGFAYTVCFTWLDAARYICHFYELKDLAESLPKS
jgi:hypothetical protein